MAKFTGPKNLHLGGDAAWAVSTYDDVSRNYVIELDDKAAAKFRALSDEDRHGFVEVDAKPSKG